MGATLDATAEDLVSFALMGAAYAARISRNPRPRVALLSNGSEAGKGPREVALAYQRLADLSASGSLLNFIGNVEGVDIPRGTADVVVCSGYVGNVVLKMLEGVSETVLRLARYAYKRKLIWRVGLAMLSGGIKDLKAITDWQEYGGAPLLGFDRLFIKAHGRSRARAIANALKVAHKAVASKSDRGHPHAHGRLGGSEGPERRRDVRLSSSPLPRGHGAGPHPVPHAHPLPEPNLTPTLSRRRERANNHVGALSASRAKPTYPDQRTPRPGSWRPRPEDRRPLPSAGEGWGEVRLGGGRGFGVRSGWAAGEVRVRSGWAAGEGWGEVRLGGGRGLG